MVAWTVAVDQPVSALYAEQDSERREDTDMKVYELVYGEYDDRGTVGMFASRELAERRIVEDALAGKCERVVEIIEHEVEGS